MSQSVATARLRSEAPPPLTPVPAFRDNYIWLVHGITDPARVAVVDPGDARPVIKVLADSRLSLEAILVTHHHADHCGGVAALLAEHPVPVYGPAREHIPGRTVAVSGGDSVTLPTLGLEFAVLDVPAHTAGHIAYFGHDTVFCGDTLFSAGCGRLFEGTAQQMLESLDRLAALPDSTRVCCGHEYTAANLRFAHAVEPDSTPIAQAQAQVATLRSRGAPTLPSTMGHERDINPFLRSRTATVRAAASRHAGRPVSDPVEVFATIRSWKDGFNA